MPCEYAIKVLTPIALEYLTCLGNMYAIYACTSLVVAILNPYYKRGVKMFPTKTGRDVGMVDDVSDATGSCMEKLTGGKSPGTRRRIPCLCNNLVNIRCLQDTL